MIEYLFLRRDTTLMRSGHSITLDQSYTWCLWKPSLTRMLPRGLKRWPYVAWWLFHHLRIFHSRNYGILTIYDGSKLIHRSCIFPKCFRFPFMEKSDLQIADTWTEETYRGRGLAVFAIERIVEFYNAPGHTFWYLVRPNNRASFHVAEKCGFRVFGTGSRMRRWNSRTLGYYAIEQYSRQQ